MAYATDNPIKKVAQMGGNSLWFYTDGDAIATVAASGYFDSAYAELKQGDLILCSIGIGGTPADLLTVTSASGATTVTTAKLA